MMQKRFEIRKTPEIMALMDKYSNYQDNFIPSEEDVAVFSILPKLSDWEKVVWFAYADNRSIMKLAKFFGIKPCCARVTIDEITDKVKKIIREEKRK